MGLVENTNRILYVSDILGWMEWTEGYNKMPEGAPHRLPQAYIEGLNYYCCRFENIDDHIQDGDIIIFQTPCEFELKRLKIIKKYVEGHHPVFITQESCVYDWFDWPAEEQSLYIDILSKCNAFLYHNEHDKKVMSLFVDKFLFYSGCTNMAAEEPKTRERQKDPESYVSLPCPVKRYQRGMISHKIAEDTLKGKEKILGMEYKRPKRNMAFNIRDNSVDVVTDNNFLSFPDCYKIECMEYINGQGDQGWNLDLQEWWDFVNDSKFGIDVHRDFSGGNVCIEYGLLGVPLVGNELCDYQRTLFPLTSFNCHDYPKIKECIYKLRNDGDFYEEVSNYSISAIVKNYASDKVMEKFVEGLQKLI